MKKILLSFLLLCALRSNAQQIVTATVTATAGTTNGQSITINGGSVYFTNNVTLPTGQILTNSTANGTSTNLYNYYISTPPASMSVSQLSSNAVTFRSFPGSANVISITGAWATVTFSTNTLSPSAIVVRVPYTSEGNAQQTNIVSGIVAMIGSSVSTNVIPANAVSFTNFDNISGSQVITGAKNFTGGLSGTGGVGTNRVEVGLITTNGINFGNPFRSPGGGFGSEQFGLSSSALTNYATAYGDASQALAVDATAIGCLAQAENTADTAVGFFCFALGGNSVALGTHAYASNYQSSALGPYSESDFTNSTAIGYGSLTTAANQIMLGQSSGTVVAPGVLTVQGSITAALHTGTNTFSGDVSLTSYGSSLVAGVNFLSTLTNSFIRITGPASAFSVDQMDNGRSGRIVILENTTAYTMTIANNSGAVSGGSKIYTGTGSGVAITSSPGIAQLIYDSTLGYWILMNHN